MKLGISLHSQARYLPVSHRRCLRHRRHHHHHHRPSSSEASLLNESGAVVEFFHHLISRVSVCLRDRFCNGVNSFMPLCGIGSDGFDSSRRRRRRQLHSQRGLRGGHSQEVRREEAQGSPAGPPQTAAAAEPPGGDRDPCEAFVEAALGQLCAARRHAEATAAPHAATGDRGHREASRPAPASLDDTAIIEVREGFVSFSLPGRSGALRSQRGQYTVRHQVVSQVL